MSLYILAEVPVVEDINISPWSLVPNVVIPLAYVDTQLPVIIAYVWSRSHDSKIAFNNLNKLN